MSECVHNRVVSGGPSKLLSRPLAQVRVVYVVVAVAGPGMGSISRECVARLTFVTIHASYERHPDLGCEAVVFIDDESMGCFQIQRDLVVDAETGGRVGPGGAGSGREGYCLSLIHISEPTRPY